MFHWKCLKCITDIVMYSFYLKLCICCVHDEFLAIWHPKVFNLAVGKMEQKQNVGMMVHLQLTSTLSVLVFFLSTSLQIVFKYVSGKSSKQTIIHWFYDSNFTKRSVLFFYRKIYTYNRWHIKIRPFMWKLTVEIANDIHLLKVRNSCIL